MCRSVNVFTPISLPTKSCSMYAAHALDDRDDRDQEHHSDGDAEQREEALELLHADLRQRETNRFDEGHAVYL